MPRAASPRFTGAAAAQDAYVVGLTGAMTGPPPAPMRPRSRPAHLYRQASTPPAASTARRSTSILQDDSAEPSKAAANVKKLLSQDKWCCWSTRACPRPMRRCSPRRRSARRAGAVRGRGLPEGSLSAGRPLQFCTTGFAANYDSRAALDFIKATAKAPVKIGFAAMAIPISRGEIDFAEELSKTLGMTPVDKEMIPPPTPDYTPFATKIKDAGANWVYSWAPWVTQVRTFEASAPSRLERRIHRLGASRSRGRTRRA